MRGGENLVHGGVVLLFLFAGACATWRTSNENPAMVVEQRDPHRVRLLVRERGALVLRNPEVRNDSLVGIVEREWDKPVEAYPDAVAVSDIVRFQFEDHKEDDVGDYAVTIGALAVGILALVLAAGT